MAASVIYSNPHVFLYIELVQMVPPGGMFLLVLLTEK